jgi:hypothetical protein
MLASPGGRASEFIEERTLWHSGTPQAWPGGDQPAALSVPPGEATSQDPSTYS